LIYFIIEEIRKGVMIMTKIKNLGRKGMKVGEVESSSGDKVYEIYDDNGTLTCGCISYAIRKSCRHIKEFGKGEVSDFQPNCGYTEEGGINE
jgi:predicted nuclease with RNAse H fold